MTAYTQEWLSEQIVRKAADAIIFADEEGIIRLWNAGAEAIFGYPAEEALGGLQQGDGNREDKIR